MDRFWPTLLTCETDKPLVKFLTSIIPDEKYEIVSPDNADIIFSSVFGNEKSKYTNKPLILFQGENEKLGFNIPYGQMKCILSHRKESLIDQCRNFTVPLFFIYHNMAELVKKMQYRKKDKFCCFVVSNPHATLRINFFNYLSKYKKIDSGGKVLNNIGYTVGGAHSSNQLIDFISQYKFCICFENSSSPGYCTEKIVQTMRAGTIPLYWGDPLISDYFNCKSFITVNNFEEAYKKIVELDSDDQKYQDFYNEPWFVNNIIPETLNINKITYEIKTHIKSLVRK